MSRATDTYAAALSLFESAAAESRVELALSESRVARLRAAAELERAGRVDEARELVDAVRAEQQELEA
jgi:hypothetical protein